MHFIHFRSSHHNTQPRYPTKGALYNDWFSSLTVPASPSMPCCTAADYRIADPQLEQPDTPSEAQVICTQQDTAEFATNANPRSNALNRALGLRMQAAVHTAQ
jgi:hypothetical protein